MKLVPARVDEGFLSRMNVREAAISEADYLPTRLAGFVIYDLFLETALDRLADMLSAIPDASMNLNWRADEIRTLARGPMVDGSSWHNVGVLSRPRKDKGFFLFAECSDLPACVDWLDVHLVAAPDGGFLISFKVQLHDDERGFHAQYMESNRARATTNESKGSVSYGRTNQPLVKADLRIGEVTSWLRRVLPGGFLTQEPFVQPPIILVGVAGTSERQFFMQRHGRLTEFLAGDMQPSIWWTGKGLFAPLRARMLGEGGVQQGFVLVLPYTVCLDKKDGSFNLGLALGYDLDFGVLHSLSWFMYPYCTMAHYLEQVIPSLQDAVSENRRKFQRLFTSSGALPARKLGEAQRIYADGAALRRLVRQKTLRFGQIRHKPPELTGSFWVGKWDSVRDAADASFQDAMRSHLDLLLKKVNSRLGQIESELEDDNRFAEATFTATTAKSNWVLQIVVALIALVALVVAIMNP